jgi:glutamate carboxypeptidase
MIWPLLCLTLFYLSLGSAGVPAQGLSGAEKSMVTAVDAQHPQALVLLRKMVEINSGTLNLEGVRAVDQILEPAFAELGFSTHWEPMDRVGRAGVLVAKHPCAVPHGCGKRILLIGHMDTVFERDSPFQSYNVQGSVGTGPGVNDMKGGLVVMLYALRAMQAADVLKNSDITAVLSGDEERPGKPLSIARKDLLDAAEYSDVALEFEPAMSIDGEVYASTSQHSYYDWRLEASGETGHSSTIFSAEKGTGQFMNSLASWTPFALSCQNHI